MHHGSQLAAGGTCFQFSLAVEHVIPKEWREAICQPHELSLHRGKANTCVGLFRGPGMLARKIRPPGARMPPPAVPMPG